MANNYGKIGKDGLVSVRQYCKERDISLQSIYQALQDGRLPGKKKSGKTVFDPKDADKLFQFSGALLMPVEPEPDPITPEENKPVPKSPKRRLSAFEARTLKEEMQARKAELDYEIKLGRYILRTDVEHQAMGAARTARDHLLAIPDRISAEIAAESNPKRCHTMMLEAIYQALQDLQENATRPRGPDAPGAEIDKNDE